MNSMIGYRSACCGFILLLTFARPAGARPMPLPAGSARDAVTVVSVASAHRFVVTPGGSDTLTFAVQGRSGHVEPAVALLELTDTSGKLLKAARQDVTLMADRATNLVFTLDLAGLAVGEYPARLRLLAGQQTLASAEHTLVVAGSDDLFLVFDAEPMARGIDFDRSGMSAAQIEVDGVKRSVWKANQSYGAEGWWHAARFAVTDPRFRAGARPVSDVAVTFRHASNSPVNLMADTSGGSSQVGSGWGNTPHWQTMTVQLDNAIWQARPHEGDPKQKLTNGCDLRFNSCNDDAELRSVFIHGYDLDRPDYRRLLRFDGLDAGRELFLFTPGEKQTFALQLRNLSNRPLAAGCTVKLLDDLGNPLWTREEKAALPAHQAFRLPVAFDTKGLKQGVYTLTLGLGEATRSTRTDLLASRINLMVSERSPILRAKPGEFLYGLDSGVGWQDERFLQWADFMGVDLLRGMGTDNPEEFDKAFALYDKYHLKAGVDFSPPYDADPARMAQRIAEVAAQAGQVARRYAGRLKYYELGNEPDLTFFYPGPMASYVQGYTAIAKAIKENDPDSVVMNGGLSFFGPEGYKRACEFVALVPSASLDAFAYHGHGPGAAAERGAYERIRAQAVRYGKANKPFIETESGFSGHSPAQIRVQARTAIQKLVYAQSVGLPAFDWFRLYISGGDGDYTNLIDVHQPRSTVLAYRTLVKTLRGYRYSRLLDLGSRDYEGYLFAQKGGTARALVVWANAHSGGRRTLALAGKAGAVSDCRRVDMFGNFTLMPEAAGGAVSVTVSSDPQFLVWRTASPAFAVATLPSPLAVAPSVALVPGGRDVIEVIVKNGTALPLRAMLETTAGAGSGVKPLAASLPVTVPAHSTRRVAVAVEVSAQTEALAWPHRWTTFVDLPTDTVDPARFTAIPQKIEAKGRTIAGKEILLKAGRIDFATLAGFVREKAEALAMTEVISPTARTLRVGAYADFWMDWYVNGKPVYDAFTGGNQGGSGIADHTFDLPLKAGTNLIVARVYSGSQGWKLTSGGPDEVALATDLTALAPGRVTFALRQDGKLVANESAAVVRVKRIPALVPQDWQGSAAAWSGRDVADGELGDGEVVNAFTVQPDASRWWQGIADLSGRIWLRADAKRLYVVVGVRDDVHVPARDAAAINVGDSIRIAFADAAGHAIDIGVPGGGGSAYRHGAKGEWLALPVSLVTVRVERVEAIGGGTTWYRVALDRSLLPASRLTMNVLANDNDWDEHKQHTAWRGPLDGPGRKTDEWFPILLDSK